LKIVNRKSKVINGQSAKVKECDVDFNAKKGELKNKFYCGDEAAKMKYLARFSPNF